MGQRLFKETPCSLREFGPAGEKDLLRVMPKLETMHQSQVTVSPVAIRGEQVSKRSDKRADHFFGDGSTFEATASSAFSCRSIIGDSRRSITAATNSASVLK